MAGSSECVGLMAVVAVSSGVALVALRIQKRLTSELVKKVELQLLSINSAGGERKAKKRVTFAADVVEPSSNNEEYRRRRTTANLKHAHVLGRGINKEGPPIKLKIKNSLLFDSSLSM